MMPQLYRIYITAACIVLASCSASAESSEFLKYQEPKPQISLLSGIDSILYMLTVFALILGLAYVTSRFLGRRFSNSAPGVNDDAVLSSLPLGPNKGIYLIHFAGRLLLIGVSEHKIELLSDLTDAPNAADLRNSYQASSKTAVAPQFSAVFASQLASLRQMSEKYPRVFRQNGDSIEKPEHDREKR